MEKETISQKQWEALLQREKQNQKDFTREYGLNFENKDFTSAFLHEGELALSFKNCIFEEKVTFSLYTPTANVFITECIFRKAVFFANIKSEYKISFLNCFETSNLIHIGLNLARGDNK